MIKILANQFLVISIFFISTFIWSQQYKPIDTANVSYRNELKSKYQVINKNFNEDLKNLYEGKKRTELVDAFEGFQEDFMREIEKGHFVNDKRFENFFNEILNEIRLKNPGLPTNIKILISKEPSVNAYAMPDGTIIMNMGCFKFLENESQIASILTHEIAHVVLKHILKGKIRQIDEELDETHKSEVAKIKKKNVGRNELAFEMMKNLVYERGSLNRTYEKQADSLGFQYFKNTKYENNEFLQAFKLLQRYDTIKPAGLSKNVYETYFDLPGQRFDSAWLKMEDFSKYDYSKFVEKINKDSISTHPETLERIELIQKSFPEFALDEPSKLPSETYKTLQEIANWEEIPNLYFLKNYGNAIYTCLVRLQEGKDDKFYKYWLGKSFEKVYEARKSYKLNRYLDTVNPKEQTESYMQFLSFMWNLNLNEIQHIAEFYSQ